jgi:hypothetical protein
MEEKDTISEEQETPPSGDESSQDGNWAKLAEGILIFLGLNFVLWLFTQANRDLGSTMVIGWLATVINLVVLGALTRYRRSEAGGMLGAFAALIILAFIIAPIFWLSQCFTASWH